MKKNSSLGILLLVGLALSACSSSKSTVGSADSGTKGDGSVEKKSDAGSSKDAGITLGTADGGSQLKCDNTVQAASSCGGTTCDAVISSAAAMCQINCCTTDNKCGQKNTSATAIAAGFGTCALPATADTRCPSQSFGGQTATGCCTTKDTCGIFGQGTPCIDLSSFTGAKARKCDAVETDAGSSEDAGN